MPIADITAYTFLGLIAGIAGGLLGIAGSVLMIPGLALLSTGTHPGILHLHQAAAMLVNAFVVAPAVFQHIRAKAVMPNVVRWTIPSAIVGAIGGVTVSGLPLFRGSGQGWLQLLFAAFLTYVIGFNAWRMYRPVHGESPTSHFDHAAFRPLTLVCLLGLPTGFLGGLLGIGGGLIAVPIQQVLLRIPLRRAIANSAATIVLSSAVAAAAKNLTLARQGWTFRESAALAILLIPGGLIGGWLGGWLTHRIPVRGIRLALLLLLAFATVRLVLWGLANLGVA